MRVSKSIKCKRSFEKTINCYSYSLQLIVFSNVLFHWTDFWNTPFSLIGFSSEGSYFESSRKLGGEILVSMTLYALFKLFFQYFFLISVFSFLIFLYFLYFSILFSYFSIILSTVVCSVARWLHNSRAMLCSLAPENDSDATRAAQMHSGCLCGLRYKLSSFIYALSIMKLI